MTSPNFIEESLKGQELSTLHATSIVIFGTMIIKSKKRKDFLVEEDD
jgi:hypothetical protein